MFPPGLYSKQNYFDQIYLCFEIIGEYSAAACTRSGAFLEQVITTSTVLVALILNTEALCKPHLWLPLRMQIMCIVQTHNCWQLRIPRSRGAPLDIIRFTSWLTSILTIKSLVRSLRIKYQTITTWSVFAEFYVSTKTGLSRKVH